MAYQADCSYYEVKDVQKLKLDSLNIFHSNTKRLESKMDIIAIRETSQRNDVNFIINTDIEGYVNFSTPSNLSKGGTALYIDDKFDSFVRTDIKIQSDNFESTWVEITNKLSRNIAVASIYR